MRVTYILTSLGVGGAERQVIWLARRMARAGHTVQLMVLLPQGVDDLLVKSASESDPANLEVIYLGMTKHPWSALQAFRHGAAALRKFHPDIIHAHNFHGNLAGRMLGWLTGNTSVISTIHNVYEGGPLRMFAYRITDPLSVRTIAVSEAARARYVQIKSVPGSKCGVVTNGIETDNFLPDPSRRNATRTETGLRENDFVWIAVGRLAPAKNYPNLLGAFSTLRKVPAAKLWIVGSGEPAYTDGLKTLARELRIENSIRWLGAQQNVAPLLDAADAFVLASAWEGMPLALGEAMAMAKPVVATDVGGVREMISEDKYLVPAEDSSALAEKMSAIMNLSNADRIQIGAAARTRILTHFSMEAKVQEWEAIYHSVQR